MAIHWGFGNTSWSPLSFLSQGGRKAQIFLLSRRTWAGVGAGVIVAGGGAFMLLHNGGGGGGVSPVSGQVSRQHQTTATPSQVNGAATVNSEVPMLAPVSGKVLAGFGWQYSGALNEWYYNPGVTLTATEGTKVYAAWGGTVKQIAQDPHMGTTLTMNDGGGFTTMYGHLGTVSVKAGQTVKQGQVLGTVGGPDIYSRQPGAHLDFSVYHGSTASDPTSFLHPSS